MRLESLLCGLINPNGPSTRRHCRCFPTLLECDYENLKPESSLQGSNILICGSTVIGKHATLLHELPPPSTCAVNVFPTFNKLDSRN